ncbi:ABC transporter ATP-binding protein [Phytoactinopolyspora alkaliphila]|uniref:ABC transporter ATP-binding protein n=1 Tax=Phytoactinopolyspora alkaliphila TaxID=1783498 RepID=A0A6N9YKW0_9ACTN|nr:ABC transporter ATP-binding protein [Phytoactinopolyspora alkaliphila]NED95711.1 ABC transporter ATP-binding protein [Phytoactinopolyspora alkaliphila]
MTLTQRAEPHDPPESDALLSVRELHTEFLREQAEPLRVVDGVSFDVERGKALAIVGESGSGKSVTVRSVLRLLPRTARTPSGEAWFHGRDLLSLSQREMRRIRGRNIGMVFQNAAEAMNPTLTLERQLTEHLLWHGICGKSEARERAVRALGDVGIPEPERRIRVYPFQLSGGMRQRAMIAMAMVTEPALLIADEPTTAVDVTVQRQILDLLVGLKDRGTGVIMITHDLGVARYFCDQAVVMYAGRVVEQAPTSELLDTPRHPYTKGLLGSSVEVGGQERPLLPIPGSPPDLAHRPAGCAFHPRCAQAESPRCQEEQELISIGDERAAACWKAETGR